MLSWGHPGRVADHLRRGTLDLSGVSFFCLDEADEMLNMGFLEDVEWILDHAPKDRQVALFSATMPPAIRRIAAKHLDKPADIRVERKTRTVEGVEQSSLRVSRFNKTEALERILGAVEHEAILVFVETQRAADGLAGHLQDRGFGAACIHGGMNQSERTAVVERLRSRALRVLVATDVAARGLDVDHIGLVVNYDLPRDPEVYVHRVGRTARAGRTGHAVSFWEPRQQHRLRAIERFNGQRMNQVRPPSVEDVLARKRERAVAALAEMPPEALTEFAAWAGEIAEQLGIRSDPTRGLRTASRVGGRPLACRTAAGAAAAPRTQRAGRARSPWRAQGRLPRTRRSPPRGRTHLRRDRAPGWPTERRAPRGDRGDDRRGVRLAVLGDWPHQHSGPRDLRRGR